MQLAGALIKVGDRGSARPLLEQNREELTKQLLLKAGNVPVLTALGVTLGMLDNRPEAKAALDRADLLLQAALTSPTARYTDRWELALARSWVDEKSVVLGEIGRLLREPSAQRLPNANVRVLRVSWATLPLHGDADFEAMLNDPRNNAPLF